MPIGTGEAPPLTAAEARPLLAPLADAARILLAVSGGPDSVALMHLAAEVAASGGHPPLAVAAVDHGLRDGSRERADAVVHAAGRLGLEARVLSWTGPKPSTGLQAAARRARYDLLGAGAAEIGATHLATAHTLDDQAETILFRIARGSGLAGLAGMRRVSRRGGLIHVRPFLSVPKARLVAACDAGGWAWFADPANADPRFARARWRRLMPLLAAEGLDAARLGTLARRLAEAEAALDRQVRAALREAALPSGPGERLLRVARLREEPAAVLVRVMAAVLADFATPGPARLSRLERAAAALHEGWRTDTGVKRTLHGATLESGADGLLRVAPAPPRRLPPEAARDRDPDGEAGRG